jgi:hypothetical protein
MNIHNIIDGVGFDKDCSDVAGSCDISSRPLAKLWSTVNRYSISLPPPGKTTSTAIQ